MDTGVPWLWLLSPLVGLAVAALLLGIGRAIKGLGRVIFRPLGKVLPTRVAWLLAIVATVFVTWTVLSGLLVGNAIDLADSMFEGNNDKDKPGVVNPDSAYRSGGPESTVTWESIGREGRAFIHQGLTASDIAGVVGDPAAVEPVRAFIGVEAAPTATERAQIAVAELRALGGFERGAIAVGGGTGSGWIDPKAANALEYATHGDVAIVSMQYSYLPSFMSYLVDQSRSATNAEQLITALRVELDGIAGRRTARAVRLRREPRRLLDRQRLHECRGHVDDDRRGPAHRAAELRHDVAEGGRRPRARLTGMATAVRRRRDRARRDDGCRPHRPDADVDDRQPDHLPHPRLRPDRRLDGQPCRVARPPGPGRAPPRHGVARRQRPAGHGRPVRRERRSCRARPRLRRDGGHRVVRDRRSTLAAGRRDRGHHRGDQRAWSTDGSGKRAASGGLRVSSPAGRR